jgi:xylulokinase
LQWVRENVLGGMDDDAMFSLAKDSPPGARSLLFVPTLAGGTWLEGGPRVRGAYVGLDVRHTRSDLARSALEGVAFALRRALDALRELVPVGDRILVVGGGSKNAVARQLYADVFGVPVVKTSVDQQAATLGAAAVALVGAGLWSGFDRVRDVHEIVATNAPDAERAQRYDELLPAFLAAAAAQERLAELLAPD